MNIMMDASSMYPEGFHPVDNWLSPDGSRMTKYYNRTQKPPKYYIIDFGLSVKFEQNCEKMLAIPSLGLDRTPPEFHGDGCSTLQDPFATDVYLFGNMIRQYFLDVGSQRLLQSIRDITRKPRCTPISTSCPLWWRG